MNRTPSVERVLREYLADDGSAAPDYVLDVVADRIGATRQRRTWPLLRRLQMNTYVKLAAAAVVAAIAVGAIYLNLPNRNGVGGESPSPAASASPSAAPSPSAVFPQWFTPEGDLSGAGILSPGTQTTRAFLPGSTFTVPTTFSVPRSWVNDTDSADFYGLFPDTPANEAEFALSGGRAQGIFMGIVDTPTLICDEAGATEGSSAAELADSAVANEALLTSEPVDVTIGRLTGTRVDARINPAWTGSCPLAPEDPPTKDYKDYRGRFVFLDVPRGGKLLIIIDSVYAADFDAFLAQAMPIVESFEFDVGQ